MLTKISVAFGCALVVSFMQAAQAQDGTYNKMNAAAVAIDQQIVELGQQIQKLQEHYTRLQQIRAQLVSEWSGLYTATGVYTYPAWKCGPMDAYPKDITKFIEPLYESALLRCQSFNQAPCERAGFSCADNPGATYTVFVKPTPKAQ